MTAASPGPAMTAVDWALLFALSLLWGGAYFFNGVAVLELPTFTIVLARVGGGALTLLLALRLLGHALPRGGRIWVAFFAMALLNNVLPFSLIVYGQAFIASGVASILNATMPVFTVVVAHWLTADEKMTGGRLAGVVIGFIGVAVLMGGEAIFALADGVIGQLACLAAALAYALAAIYGRRFRAMGVAPVAAATGQVIASTVILTPVALFIDTPWRLPTPSLATIGALAGVAVLSTGFGYLAYFRLLASAGAANTSLVTMLIPVSAILLGAAFLGEIVTANQLLGMAIIGLALAAIDGRPLAFLRRGMGGGGRQANKL